MSNSASNTPQVHRSVTRVGGTELRPLHLLTDTPQQGTAATQSVETDKPSKQVLKRRFPVSHNKLSFEPRSPPKKHLKTSLHASAKLKNSPNANYHEFLILDQAGDARIANDNTVRCNLVAIKRKVWKGSLDFECSQEVRHENIVNLIDLFVLDKEIHVVYEQMDVSLELINGIPRGRWQAFEIAAICKEVLNGISFLHEVLGMYHGAIECSSIMLSRDGHIKLANVGDCILGEHGITDATASADTRSVGLIMMELMERESSIHRPTQVSLARPEVWKDEWGIKDFLDATKTEPLGKLKDHHFLPRESNREQLKPHVFIALIAGKTNWDVIAPPSSSEHPRRLQSLPQ